MQKAGGPKLSGLFSLRDSAGRDAVKLEVLGDSDVEGGLGSSGCADSGFGSEVVLLMSAVCGRWVAYLSFWFT